MRAADRMAGFEKMCLMLLERTQVTMTQGRDICKGKSLARDQLPVAMRVPEGLYFFCKGVPLGFFLKVGGLETSYSYLCTCSL